MCTRRSWPSDLSTTSRTLCCALDLAYMREGDGWLPIAAGISGEQPLEEVAYTVSDLVSKVNACSFAAINCANQLSGLWRAGLVQFTIPVRFPHD